VNGITGWTALMLSDESVAMQWDLGTRTIDLRNTTENRAVLVSLPSKTVARVATGATFQFSGITLNTFATAATGGEVVLYDTRIGRDTALHSSNQLFNGGVPAGLGEGEGRERVTMSWDTGSPLQLSALKSQASVDVNGKALLKDLDNNSVSVRYLESGEVEVQAIAGNYTLRIESLNGMSIDLPQGQIVYLTLDQKQGTFVVRANDDNVRPVGVTTLEGYSPQLPASKALNFNLAKGTGVFKATSSQGNLEFFEKAGSSTQGASGAGGTGTGLPNPFIPTRDTDTSRIPSSTLTVGSP